MTTIVIRTEQDAESKLKSWTCKFEREIVDLIDPRLRRTARLMNTGKPRVAKKNIKRFQRALRAAGCYVDLINDGGEICLSLKRTADDVMLVTLGVVAEYKAEKGEVVFACTITKNEEGENG